jgi:hypothetical protein
VGAGAGAGVGFAGAAGGAVVDVAGAAELLAVLLDPQPLVAETKNKIVSGANAENALDLCTITTCS